VSVWRRVVVERRRTVLPLALLLAVNVAVLGLVVLPLRRSVASREQGALAAMSDLAAARREALQARAAGQSTERADRDLRAFYETVLPRGFDQAVQVTGFWLNSVASRAGVQFERGQYEPERVEDSPLERMMAKATLTGDYDGVRRFLHAVESAPEFVIIDRVELAQPNDVNEGQLELLLDVSTYYRAPAASRVRGSER
jgi:hypothetical protein